MSAPLASAWPVFCELSCWSCVPTSFDTEPFQRELFQR